MENATQALEMAGAVMLFVLALSIILLSFGQARESADIILNYRDRETMYIDANYYYPEVGTTRNVNLETMIPSIFRAYLENYKIIFDGLDSPLYKIDYLKDNLQVEKVEKYTLDLETSQNRKYRNVTLANDEAKIKFLKGIVYGKFDSTKEQFAKDFHIDLTNCEPLYKQLTEAVGNGQRTITEHLGVYYQNDDENVPDVMKTEKRIITYRIQ